MMRRLLLVVLVLTAIISPALAVNLTFSNGTGVTVNPTTVGQYYADINATNLSWVEIGKIVPEPLVDTFGGGELGWRIAWFTVFGICFIIMFGRQRNVLIPLLVAWVVAFFLIEKMPQELNWVFYAFAAASLMGVIFYLAVSKR